MRNLKKVLSLVLCVAMMLSVMVMSTGATSFSDEDEFSPQYKEAAEVLTGMGVMQGYEDGSYFLPQRNITRAQVATLIYRAVTGDVKDTQTDLYTDYNKFEDVPSTHWSAGYVNYCANGELIKGFTPDTFGPNKNVTGYQVLAMILRAMGYDQNDEFTGDGWAIRVATTAQQLGILKNVNEATLGAYASRELVAELIFQAMNENMVDYTPAFGYQPTWPRETLGEREFGLTSATSYIVGNQATGEDGTILGYNENKDGSIFSTYSYANNGANKEFNITTGLEEFGHQTKVWYDADSMSKGIYTTVYATMDQATNSSLTEEEYNDLTADEKADFIASSKYHDHFERSFSGAPAAYNMVVNNEDGTKALVGLWLVVDQYTAINNYGSTKTVSFGDDIGTKVDQDKVDGFEALTLGDYVNGIKVTGTDGADKTLGYYKWNVSELAAQIGNVTTVATKDGTITLSDGSKIDQAYDALLDTAANDGLTVPGKNGAPAWDFDATYTIYTDILGNYVAAVPESTVSYLKATYGYFETNNAAGTVKYFLQGVTEDGTEVTVQLTDVAEYNKLAATNAITYLNYGDNKIVSPTGNVADSSVILDAQADGTYTIEHYLGDGDCSTQAAVVGQVGQNVVRVLENGAATVTTSTKTLGAAKNYFFTDDTKFVFVSGYGDNLSIVTKTGLDELVGNGVAYTLPEISVVIAYQDYSISTGSKNFAIDTVIVHGDYASTGSLVYFNDNAKVGTNANGEVYNGYINGTETQITVATGTSVDKTFYNYSVDADGVYTLSPADTDDYDIGNLSNDQGTNYSYVKMDGNTQHAIASDAIIVNLTDNDNAPTTAAALVEAAEQNTITVALQLVDETVTVVYITAM